MNSISQRLRGVSPHTQFQMTIDTAAEQVEKLESVNEKLRQDLTEARAALDHIRLECLATNIDHLLISRIYELARKGLQEYE